MPTNEWPPPVILGLQAGAPLLRDDGRYGAFERSALSASAFDFYARPLPATGSRRQVSGTEVSNLYQEFARGNIAMYTQRAVAHR